MFYVGCECQARDYVHIMKWSRRISRSVWVGRFCIFYDEIKLNSTNWKTFLFRAWLYISRETKIVVLLYKKPAFCILL